MAKTEPIGIRLDPAERAALEKAATADDRSMSALARRVLADWLRKNGWLKIAESNRSRANNVRS
jgi:hypothetical protein